MSQKQWLKFHLSLALCLLLFARVIIQLKMLHCVYMTPDFTPKPNLEDCSCLTLDCIQCQCICQHARSGVMGQGRAHTPSTAFRHLPPNSARFGYATEGVLFIRPSDLGAVNTQGFVWKFFLCAIYKFSFIHSLSPRSCSPTRSAPFGRFQY